MQISQPESSEPTNPRSRNLRVGERVRVRRQRWVITERKPFEDCEALTLSGVGPGNVGEQQQILTPFDLVEPLTSPRSFRIVRVARWRRACRQLIAEAGTTGILRTARSARMDLMPHQLEPALAVVYGRGARILIADEVGLGKTVQAALIVAELRVRAAVSRALILTPAGLRDQWVDECGGRFGLPLEVFDIAAIAHRRASLPVGLNPWSIAPFVVTSIDYVKRPEVLPAVQACRWDVVVVDEAHHAALKTDRHAAVQSLCSTAPYVLLLTATPHNGDPKAFHSLCDLGQHDDELLVFRRTKQELGHHLQRRTHQLRVRPRVEERRMHAAMDAFVRAVHREPDGRSPSTWLALSTLRKRALSSAFALWRSVEHRLTALDQDDSSDARQLTLPIFEGNGEFDTADSPPAWTVPPLGSSRHERDLLSRVAHAAQLAIGHESKLAALARLLRRIKEPAIVFTEYRDTLIHVRDHVAPHATILHGGLSREERRAALTAFTRGTVLLATDAAGEGLNLHHNCRIVVNLELPWNPIRLEQRIGRVDRIGQARRVHAFHLIAGGTAEMRVLQQLGSRIARARAEIGAHSPFDGNELIEDSPIAAATSRMKAEAASEHARLTLARQLIPDRPTAIERTPDVDRHTLVTFSKRRSVRSRLNSRPLVVVRSVLVDSNGQPIAHHLTSLQLAPETEAASSFRLLERLRSRFPHDSDYDGWLMTSCSIHSEFWNRRLRRERSIARLRESLTSGELQPGLFDLRAEQLWADLQEQRRNWIRDGNWFVDSARRNATLETELPQIALVLFTR